MWTCLLPLLFCVHFSLQCILWNKVFLVWKLYWSCSVFEMIICRTRFLSAKFGHGDYIILTFKSEFVCPACSDFITSRYLNAPEALKLHTNGFSLYYYDIHCVHCYKRPHLTWPQFWCHTAHTKLDQNHFLMMEIVTWNIPLSNGKTENSLLGVRFWGSVSHFRSRPFVTGSNTDDGVTWYFTRFGGIFFLLVHLWVVQPRIWEPEWYSS